MSEVFPFSAVVANDELKLALILAGIDSRIGGVLIEGEKGTAKTTLARGLGQLLPKPTNFIELPLGTSEERLKGSIDLEHLIREKTIKLSQGLFGKANGGVLYVDEVNLLADHLVDMILDVAASGENRIERDDLSIIEPAKFVLLGSMNREEGWLRPQLLDRFGLFVRAESITDPALRVEAAKRRIAFDAAPKEFCDRFKLEDAEIKDKIEQGRLVRSKNSSGLCAKMSDEAWDAVSNHISDSKCGSLRADLVLVRAACVFAFWSGVDTANETHVNAIAPLVLQHRTVMSTSTMPRSPLTPKGTGRNNPDPSQDEAKDDEKQTQANGTSSDTSQQDDGSHPNDRNNAERRSNQVSEANNGSQKYQETSFALDKTKGSSLDIFGPSERRNNRPPSVVVGRGPNNTVLTEFRGQSIATKKLTSTDNSPIDIVASFRNSVVESIYNKSDEVAITSLWGRIRQSVQARLLIVVLDVSGSMGVQVRVDMAKDVLVGALETSYERRNRVALISFCGDDATVVLRPTRSVELATHKLATLVSGGMSPLAKGLDAALLLAQNSNLSGLEPTILTISDFRPTSDSSDALSDALVSASAIRRAKVASIFVDLENSHPRLGIAQRLADQAGSRVLRPFESHQ